MIWILKRLFHRDLCCIKLITCYLITIKFFGRHFSNKTGWINRKLGKDQRLKSHFLRIKLTLSELKFDNRCNSVHSNIEISFTLKSRASQILISGFLSMLYYFKIILILREKSITFCFDKNRILK